MKVKTSYEGCNYITPNKEYKVMFDAEDGSPWIVDDDEDYIDIDLDRTCFYLNDEGTWEMIE